MKNFALIGAAGYIAVRHLKAIKETNNNLVAALDPFDSVGIIDSYFPEYKLKREGHAVDYVSICSPNYLHDSHIRFALRQGADAICEKPLVLNPWNVDALKEYEQETGKRVYNILQLRLHPAIIALKKQIDEGDKDKIYDIDLSYITSRGKWYHFSWKGDNSKSGGVATNIGIHFFDMLTWIFGDVEQNIVHERTESRSGGFIQLKKARVRWFLSVNYEDLPQHIKDKGQRTYRSIEIENRELEFSEGFTDLHTLTYQGILAGNGFGLDDAFKSISMAHEIRNAPIKGLTGDYHPLFKNI